MNKNSIEMIERAKDEVTCLTDRELYRELDKFIQLCDHLNPLKVPWTLDINEIAQRENSILGVLKTEFLNRLKE